MKLKLLAAACGLAFGSQAFALTPAVSDAASTVKVYLSGSSAQVRVIKAIATTDCAAGTADTFQLTSDAGNVFAISCTLGATAGGGASGLGGKNVLLTYNANGGSANGVYPIAKLIIPATNAINVAQTAALQRPQLTNLSGAGICTSAGTVSGNPGTTYNCTATANQFSDAGVSDAEPALFNVELNRPAAWTGQTISPAEFLKIDTATQFQQIFGLAVSQNLYNALQAMQFAAGEIPTATSVPSLSKTAVASYLAGNFFDPSSGYGWQPLFATSTLAVPAAANGTVNICTRSAGSGTKASANSFFLNNPCGSAPVLPATAAQSVPGSFVVNEGGSTGAVTTCLTAANTAGEFAIGIVGKENALPTGAQFVAIDGVAPGKDNVKNGKYDWFVEQSMQWNPTYLTNFKSASLPSGVTSAQLINYLGNFRTRSGAPDVMNTYSTTVQDGVAAISDGVNYIFNDSANANNKKFVSRVTKLGNSCGVTQWIN